MSVSVAQILAELRTIARHSTRDVAVLMEPLLRAFEDLEAGRNPPWDQRQAMSTAASLAQAAAQAGDMDAAVGIAALAAEIEQLTPEDFIAAPMVPAEPESPVAAGPATPPRPFDRPYQQALGILAVCALSYAGYLEINARVLPGTLTSWLLTGSSILLALGLGLSWRRFVLRRAPGPRWTTAALVLVLATGAWAVSARLELSPQRAAMHTPQTQTVEASGAPDTSAPTQHVESTADGVESTQAPAPAISFWWLGETPPPPTSMIQEPGAEVQAANLPREFEHTRVEQSQPGRAEVERTQDTPPVASASAPAPAPAQDIAPLSVGLPPPPSLESVAAPTPGPASPMTLYGGLLEHPVVMIDNKGKRREGKLTGLSKHGITLLTEVRMFGETIPAERFYDFGNIRSLRAK